MWWWWWRENNYCSGGGGKIPVVIVRVVKEGKWKCEGGELVVVEALCRTFAFCWSTKTETRSSSLKSFIRHKSVRRFT